MTLKVEINHPEMEKDLEFDLGGFLVPNGGSVELSEDQERSFAARHQIIVKDALANSPYIKVSGNPSLNTKELDSIIVESNSGQLEELVDIVEPATEEAEGSDD